MTQARVSVLSDSGDAADPQYVEGQRAAVRAALDYGLAAVECGEERSLPVPDVLRSQARLAARSGHSLDAVLRRYFAGYTLLGDFLVEEAEDGDLLAGVQFQRLLRVQATVFDRLIATISEEYNREAGNRLNSSEQRRAERVRRLLDGELIETAGLVYDFEAYHVGVIATGPGVADAIRELARVMDRRVLLIHPEEETLWAWLGGRREIDPVELESHVAASWPPGLSLAVGEPGHGLAGWRLTHKQAQAALPIALRRAEPLVRYADVALLASMFQDDLLATSLRELYLVPLERERDGGEISRETLGAYFAAERNISSAAAALGVSRRTVANRMRSIETKLGVQLKAVGAEIEAALHLHDLSVSASVD